MLRTIGLVVAIGLGDSVNPSTIVPALYIASGNRPRRRAFGFTLAVFTVHLAAGVLLALGPGHLLLSLLNGLDHTIRDVLEIAAGLALLTGAIVVWRRRRHLAEKNLPKPPPGKSSVVLGATIIAVELPTAFPYFTAIAAILGSTDKVAAHLLMVGLYNVCFVLPLIAILIVLLFAGERTEQRLARGRESLQQRWPTVLASMLVVGGLFLSVAGVATLATAAHRHPGRSVGAASASRPPRQRSA